MIKAHERGFTLIELVVVIVILGILAAFAVPRFMGLETEARVSAIKTMGASMRSAAIMAHGACMAQNCTNAAVNVRMNGQDIPFINQYPTAAGIKALIETDGSGFVDGNANGSRQRKSGAKTANCFVQYNAAAVNAAPAIVFWGNPGTLPLTNANEAAIDRNLRDAC